MFRSQRYALPAAGEKVVKALGRQALASNNQARVQSNVSLFSFMFAATKSGAPGLYNKRSTLPAAKKIAAFNAMRLKRWRVRADMRTDEEMAFSAQKRGALSALKLSRNHKIPDRRLGEMLQKTVISRMLDDPKTHEVHYRRMLTFATKMLQPLPMEARVPALMRFRSNLDNLVSNPAVMTRGEYRKHFDAAKKELSSSLSNLRLGRAGPNSAMGESIDPNAVRATRKQKSGRLSPISKYLMAAHNRALPELSLDAAVARTSSGSAATSSFTTLGNATARRTGGL